MTHKPLMDIQSGKYLLHPEGLSTDYYDLCRVPNGDMTQTPEKIFSRTLNEAWSKIAPFVDINTEYDVSYSLYNLLKGEARGCSICHPEGITPLPLDDHVLDQEIRDTKQFIAERLIRDLDQYQCGPVSFTFTYAGPDTEEGLEPKFSEVDLTGQLIYADITYPLSVSLSHPLNLNSALNHCLDYSLNSPYGYTEVGNIPGSDIYPVEFQRFIPDVLSFTQPETVRHPAYTYYNPEISASPWLEYDSALSKMKDHLKDIATAFLLHHEESPEWSPTALATKSRVENFLGALYVKTSSGWSYHPLLKTYYATFHSMRQQLASPSVTFHIDAVTGKVRHVGISLAHSLILRKSLKKEYLQIERGAFLPLLWLWNNPEKYGFAAYFGHDIKRFPSRKQLDTYIQQAYDHTSDLRQKRY